MGTESLLFSWTADLGLDHRGHAYSGVISKSAVVNKSPRVPSVSAIIKFYFSIIILANSSMLVRGSQPRDLINAGFETSTRYSAL